MVDEDYNFSPLKATMAQKIENYFSIFVGVGSKIELGKFFFISRGSTRLATKYGDISHSSSSFLNSLKTRHGNIKERYLHPKTSNVGFFCSNIALVGHHHPLFHPTLPWATLTLLLSWQPINHTVLAFLILDFHSSCFS